jgi:glycosyltransferase involved in cell wall biosynthesis
MTSRQQRLPNVSCVLPAFNEADNLPNVVPDILQALRGLFSAVELIIIDDGSRDATLQVARRLSQLHPEVVVLELSRNFGKECALTAGLQATRGEVVVLMDADGQHPVTLLPEMLAQWQKGMDVVYAVRRSRLDQSPVQRHLTGLFYELVNFGNRVKIPAHAGDFRLMDRAVVNALNALPERNRFMKGLYAWVGFPSIAIDYEPLLRQAGKSNFGLMGSIKLALTGFTAFSIAPLRLLTLLGLLMATLSMAYGVWITIDYFVWGINVPGFATVMVSTLFLSGVQMLGIGVVAEYVGRVYEEVKQRPTFLVRQRDGSGLPAPVHTSSPAEQAVDVPVL